MIEEGFVAVNREIAIFFADVTRLMAHPAQKSVQGISRRQETAAEMLLLSILYRMERNLNQFNAFIITS
jgi:hypothetical protein